MNVTTTRGNWLRRIQQVMRSRHYAWLAEARDGEPVEDVLRDILADAMHICSRQGIDWEMLLAEATRQCEREEAQAMAVA